MPRPDLSRLRVDTLDAAQPLARHLILVFRAFESEVLEALHEGGYGDLTASDLDILRFVDPAGSRAVDIARLAGITKQGVGKALADLEARGYIARRDDPADSRARVIVFTRTGETLIGKAIGEIRRIEQRYARLLGAARLKDVKRMLRVLWADHRERSAAR